jgi:hypothetical protein
VSRLPQSRAFAARASHELRLRVYSYSIFHVYFEQYLDVGSQAAALLGLPLLAVLAAAFGLTGSLQASPRRAAPAAARAAARLIALCDVRCASCGARPGCFATHARGEGRCGGDEGGVVI